MTHRAFSMPAVCAAAVLAALVSVPSPAQAQVQGTVIIQSGAQLTYRNRPPPPPPRAVARPSQRRGQVWVKSHWEWRGSRYAWNDGYWVKARRGYAYAQPRWEEQGGQWRYARGEWRPVHHRGDRDSDHDGIRNRYDNDRDNDGLRNNRDRDRDGDGVRNNRDRKPDNPNRY